MRRKHSVQCYCLVLVVTGSMMSVSLLFVVGTLLCYVRYASSILCYDCNSAFDPRCGEQFDSFSLGIINCSLKDPPDHVELPEPSFCRSIKMQIDGKVRVVRQCGYLAEDNVADVPCRRVTGTGDLFVTYCTCNTDLCNAGIKGHQEMALLSLICIVFLLIIVV